MDIGLKSASSDYEEPNSEECHKDTLEVEEAYWVKQAKTK